MSRWWITKRRSDEGGLYRVTRYRGGHMGKVLTIIVVVLVGCAVVWVSGWLIGKGSEGP